MGEILSREGEILEEKKNKLRAKSLKTECSFKPDIGEFNRQLASNQESEEQFLARMAYSKKISEEAFESKRQQIKFFEEFYDKNNDQELFKPKISNYENIKNLDRKSQGYRSVFDALHQEARILKEKKHNLAKSCEKAEEQAHIQYLQNKICPNSAKILEKVQKAKLSELFEQLDNDYDGYISAQKIDISKLPNELLDVLTPLLLKIEEHALKLNFDQFVEIVLEFAKRLSLPDKTLLLGQTRELYKSPPEQPSFTPTLSANTKTIMQMGSKEKRKVNLWEDHRVRGNTEKENEQMYECTLHPQTIKYNPAKFKRGIKSKMGIKDTLIQTMTNAKK